MKRFISMMVATTASLFVSMSAFSAGGPLAGDDDTSTTTEPLMKVHLTAGGVDTYRQSEIAYITFTPDASAVQHEFVDLGLPSGTLWATCNVGATSPGDSGDYFAWGEVETKDIYVGRNYKYFYYDSDGDCTYMFSKYNSDHSFGDVDYKTVLEPMDDAATMNWGSSWRTPTKEEAEELIEYTDIYSHFDPEVSVWCYKYVNRQDPTKFIIMPMAGYYNTDGNPNRYGYNQYAYYMTSTRVEQDPREVYNILDGKYITAYSRYEGKPVRPVFIRPN